MTVYFNFYDTSENGEYGSVPEATSGELSTMKIRRGVVDFSKQSVAATQVANAIKIYAGEIVCDVYARAIVAEDTTNGAVDVGYNGSAAVGADFDIETANNFLANVTLVPTYFAADNAVTLTPNNVATCNTAKVEVVAFVTKGFQTF